MIFVLVAPESLIVVFKSLVWKTCEHAQAYQIALEIGCENGQPSERVDKRTRERKTERDRNFCLFVWMFEPILGILWMTCILLHDNSVFGKLMCAYMHTLNVLIFTHRNTTWIYRGGNKLCTTAIFNIWAAMAGGNTIGENVSINFLKSITSLGNSNNMHLSKLQQLRKTNYSVLNVCVLKCIRHSRHSKIYSVISTKTIHLRIFMLLYVEIC